MHYTLYIFMWYNCPVLFSPTPDITRLLRDIYILGNLVSLNFINYARTITQFFWHLQY